MLTPAEELDGVVQLRTLVEPLESQHTGRHDFVLFQVG